MPAVDQVECYPYYQQKELRKLLDKYNVNLEAWGPFGQGNQKLLNDPVLAEIAQEHGKNIGQIILRFLLQSGFIVLPKSTKPERMKGNLQVFDFELTNEEMHKIIALDTGKGRHDPDADGVGEYLIANFNVHAND